MPLGRPRGRRRGCDVFLGGPSTERAVPTASAAPSSSVAAPSRPCAAAADRRDVPLFRKTTLALDELGEARGRRARARAGRQRARLLRPADGSYIARSTADRQGISFTSQPVLWSPEPGQQVLVVAARGKAASFVAAWWLLPGGGYRLASTFVMMGEIAPVALAYKPTERSLWWTSCWQCPGETGHVSVREDHHVVIVQD